MICLAVADCTLWLFVYLILPNRLAGSELSFPGLGLVVKYPSLFKLSQNEDGKWCLLMVKS